LSKTWVVTRIIGLAYTPSSQSSTNKPAVKFEKTEEEKVVPAATGPMSEKLSMATHTDFKVILPWIALGLASAVFIGVIAVLVSVLARKKDE